MDYDYVYSIWSGRFAAGSDRRLIAVGYSGRKGHVNDPHARFQVGIGPIPPGLYRLCPAYNHPRLGPVAIRLEPIEADLRGRSGFFIHGDNRKGDQSASSGCIILDRATRENLDAGIAAGSDRLWVI